MTVVLDEVLKNITLNVSQLPARLTGSKVASGQTESASIGPAEPALIANTEDPMHSLGTASRLFRFGPISIQALVEHGFTTTDSAVLWRTFFMKAAATAI